MNTYRYAFVHKSVRAENLSRIEYMWERRKVNPASMR